MMRISFAVLAIAALVTAGCLSGDDDDDDGYECDFGQDSNQFGPNSPMQQAYADDLCDGMGVRGCVENDPDLAHREIEWTCHCDPEACERKKYVFDLMGIEY